MIKKWGLTPLLLLAGFIFTPAAFRRLDVLRIRSGRLDDSPLCGRSTAATSRTSRLRGRTVTVTCPNMRTGFNLPVITRHRSCCPRHAGRSLVFCTPFSRVIALDPATGKERWSYAPKLDLPEIPSRLKCLGVAYWQDPEAAQDQPARIESSSAPTTGASSPSMRNRRSPCP